MSARAEEQKFDKSALFIYQRVKETHSAPFRGDPVETGARSQFASLLTFRRFRFTRLIFQHFNPAVHLSVARDRPGLLTGSAYMIALRETSISYDAHLAQSGDKNNNNAINKQRRLVRMLAYFIRRLEDRAKFNSIIPISLSSLSQLRTFCQPSIAGSA